MSHPRRAAAAAITRELSLTLVFCLLTALGARGAAAQVNTERFRPAEDGDGFSGLVDGRFALRAGNAALLDTTATVSGRVDRGAFMAWTLVQGRFAGTRPADAPPGRPLWSREGWVAANALVHQRVGWSLGPRWDVEAFAQAQRDEILLLRRRLLIGAGPRWAALDGDAGSVHVGLAAMGETEVLFADAVASDEPLTVRAPRASGSLTGALRLGSHTKATTTAYVQPRLDRPADFRVLVESGLQINLTSAFALTAAFTLRHDSAPPALADGGDLRPTDLQLDQGLNVRF